MKIKYNMLAALSSLLLSGCNAFLHTDGDMKKYVRENISPLPFTILEIKTLNTHSDSLDKTKYWKLCFNDRPDCAFYVYSGLVASSGVPDGYYLRTNFDNIFAVYYLREFKREHAVKLDAELYPYHDFPFEVYVLKGRYSSAAEARLLAGDIEKFWAYIKSQPHPCEIHVGCEYVAAEKKSRRCDIHSSATGKMYHPKIQVPVTAPFNAATIEQELLNNISALDRELEAYEKGRR